MPFVNLLGISHDQRCGRPLYQPTGTLSFRTEGVVAAVLWIAWMLWACRVMSVTGGFGLFFAVPQAQGLSYDISYGAVPESLRGRLYWGCFSCRFFSSRLFPLIMSRDTCLTDKNG